MGYRTTRYPISKVINKMEFKMDLPETIVNMMDKLESHGFECFVVGGAVRDAIMGITPKDYDLATNARSEDLIRIFDGIKTINPNGEKHNTVTFRTNGLNLEFTTYRDLKGDNCDKLTDCLYRDFTINAIMYSNKDGIYDPFNGVLDIENKIINSPGSAEERIDEDPNRILRAIRFSLKYGFKISSDVRMSIHKLKDGLRRVSVERIKSELDSILIQEDSYKAFMEYRDVFSVIIPEIEVMFDYDQMNKFHKNDLYTHSLNVFKNVSEDVSLKTAALLHDIGKPNKMSEEILSDGSVTHHYYLHPLESSKIANEILLRLRYSNKEIKNITYYIENHEMDYNPSKKSIRRLLIKAPGRKPELVRNLFILKKSDSMDHVIDEFDISKAQKLLDEIVSEKECLSVNDLKITGFEINRLGFYGREVGKIKRSLLNLILDGELINEKEELLSAIKSGKANLKGNDENGS